MHGVIYLDFAVALECLDKPVSFYGSFKFDPLSTGLHTGFPKGLHEKLLPLP
jgi:hypothetical protein